MMMKGTSVFMYLFLKCSWKTPHFHFPILSISSRMKKKLTLESCFLSLEKEKSQMLEDWQGICTVSKSKVKNKNVMRPSRITILISRF